MTTTRIITIAVLVSPWITQGMANAASLAQVGSTEIGTRGYVRMGSGISDGETQVCFKAPGAGAKYRLGNECEFYGKASLYFKHQKSNKGTYLHVEIMPEFVGKYGDKIRYTKYEQNFIEIGNIAGTGIDLWAGRRYNKRRDIHINDYFYMNMEDDGIGIKDIPVGSFQFSYSYLFKDITPGATLAVTSGDIRHENHDFALYGISPNKGGNLKLDLRISRIRGDNVQTGTGPVSIHSATGWTFTIQHEQKNFLRGKNTLAIQYGQGAARSAWNIPHESRNAIALLTSSLKADQLEDASTWRLVNFHVVDGKQWAMMTSFLWEKKDSKSFDGIDQTWVSAGVRPMRFIGKHWRLVGELGIDRVDSASQEGSVRKITIAAERAPKRSFWSRPALRAYVTHAQWSEAFRGSVGTPEYSDTTRGWNAGIQLEAWW